MENYSQHLDQVAKTVIAYTDDPVIMDFVEREALSQVSKELNDKGLSTTPKGVSLLIQSKKNSSIKDRVDAYISSGLIGCYMASQKNLATKREPS